jgi:serine/threonine-protein kinase
MQCPDDALLQDFVDERSPAHVNVLVRMHLRSCASCRELVAHLGTTPEPARPFEGTARLWGEVGTVLGHRYRLTRRIGEGAMGVVWSAHDETQREAEASVAVKLLRLPDSVSARRFAQECRILTRLQHRHIVRVLDVAEPTPQGHAYVVMELLTGETLEDTLLRETRLAVPAALGLAQALLSAMVHAHGAGVVHRDLKPHNVFMHGPAGTSALPPLSSVPAVPKVIDFGLAKPTANWNARASTLTQTGTVVGTPRYMAPEQLFDDPRADHRVDLWALGVVLYRAMSGAFPHEGRTLGEIVRAFAERRAVPLAARVPDIPLGVARFVGRLLGREPADRPATAAAALAELAALQADHSESPV